MFTVLWELAYSHQSRRKLVAVGEVLTELLHFSSFVLVGTRNIALAPKHTAMGAFIRQKKPRSGRIAHSA